LFGSPGGKKPRHPSVRRRQPGGVIGREPLPRRMVGDGYDLPGPGARKAGPLERAPERLRAEADRRKQRSRRIALVSVGVAVLLLAAGAIGVYAYAKHIEATMQRTIVKTEKLSLDLKAAEPQKPYTMLLMGFDKRHGDTVYRTDTIILARIDPKTKQMWLLSIPRDTRVNIPGHGVQKINAAYALGQEELAVKTVERFTDVPINHFMAVNFDGFQKAVDAMGGVWVDVPVEINDREADRTPGDKNAHIDKGYQLLDGPHALTFMRSRHGYVDQDFGRMRSQQLFFRALADQIKKTSITKIPGLVTTVAPYVTTDMSLMDMLRTAQALQGAGSKNVYTATLMGEWRTPYVWTDEAKKAELLSKMGAGEPFEPKKSKESSSTTPSGAAAVQVKKPSQITVTVRNGAGIAGCAKQASSILKARAFKVGEVGNAGQFVYENTLVVYKKDRNAAEQVAAMLPPGAKIVQSRGMYAYDSEVLVVVGKDWDITKVPVASR
jgi:LCP family protein required for cell wall assembly